LKIATRAAKEVKNGMNVNLGIGIPTLLPSVLPVDVKINLQSENGIMGVGPYPTVQNADPNNINAGKVKVFLILGNHHIFPRRFLFFIFSIICYYSWRAP
jgi:3-oxoacid CoA-transferase B subunit